MPRAAKLGRHKGYWYTKSGSRAGVYFGRVGEVPFSEANNRFRKYLLTLNTERRCAALPQMSVAETCDRHLRWIQRERSPALLSQRTSVLNHWCNHVVDLFDGQRLPGHGKLIGRLRATVITRAHVEQYLQHRRENPSEHTGRPLGDKGQRAIVIAVKACWNWAADETIDGGGGLLPPEHRPLAKLSRGFVAPKDLTEADLATDAEVEVLFRWAAVEPTKVRDDAGAWRDRLPDEYYTHDSRVFADMLHVYHATGARTSELCAAVVRDFMPRTRQICLGKHKRVRTQRNPTLRNIQIGRPIYEILARNSRGKPPQAPLFSHDDGSRWDLDQVNKRLKRVIVLANARGQVVRDHFTAYSFRDLYISELLMIGTPTFQVAKLAGTSMGEIERTYGHFFNRDLATAQARLDDERARRTQSGAEESMLPR
jgi:integrase